MRSRLALSSLLVFDLLLSLSAARLLAQATKGDSPIEAIPDPVRIPPAEIAYVNPLYQALDTPPRIVSRPAPTDITLAAPFVLALHLDEAGKVLEPEPVEPPLKGLAVPLPALTPKWRFAPARKDGRPVATWATFALDLELGLTKASFATFNVQAVGKDDPIPALAQDLSSGDDWMRRYPKEIVPKEPAVVSVEEVSSLPVPEKTKWSWDATRLRSHITALLEISPAGAVRRIVPTGAVEPLLATWLKIQAVKWKFTPATAQGKPVAAWASLDASLEYTLDSAREKGKRSIQKNLRGTPAE